MKKLPLKSAYFIERFLFKGKKIVILILHNLFFLVLRFNLFLVNSQIISIVCEGIQLRLTEEIKFIANFFREDERAT